MNFARDINARGIRQRFRAVRQRIFRRYHKIVNTSGSGKGNPFASIIWSRFDGSPPLPRRTLSPSPAHADRKAPLAEQDASSVNVCQGSREDQAHLEQIARRRIGLWLLIPILHRFRPN
jgi:hypothetical protein